MRFASLCFLVFLVGCGTYRTNGGGAGYRGMGAFKISSDYAPDNDSDHESQIVGKSLSPHAQYIPRYPFKLR